MSVITYLALYLLIILKKMFFIKCFMLFLYVIFIDKQFILEIIIVFVKISNNEFFYKNFFR